jgi:NAD kinase
MPPTLPKIVTFSKGSLNYLCNFDVHEYKEILNATALAKTNDEMESAIAVEYRSRLACTVENTSSGNSIPWKKMFVNSDGEIDY